jgi:hypothetical protein
MFYLIPELNFICQIDAYRLAGLMNKEAVG